MNINFQIIIFAPDHDNGAVVEMTNEVTGEVVGQVNFDFKTIKMTLEKITDPTLPFTSQAKMMLVASEMIDSVFDQSAESIISITREI